MLKEDRTFALVSVIHKLIRTRLLRSFL
jgi:hypothetical protein